MATFVIDTNKINNIKKSITNEVLPKVNTSYNTVVSVKNNLPSSVYWRKWLWTSLPNLYNDIENISEDVVKISDMLYKAIEKMDDAEARIKKWYKLKKDTVEAGKVAVKKVNKFKSRVSDEIDEAKSFLEGKIDAIYETGCEVVETVENYFKDEFLDDAKQFFETAAATVVVAVESLIKGLYLLLTTIVDLALIVGTVVITPFTALADGVNYLITGESGGYTKYYWDGTMAMVADVTESVVGLSNWFVENNPDWVNENSLIESGGMVDQIIQGVAYMAGIVLISVATFGAATPAALACTAGTLGFAKGTAEAWQEGKDAAAGLLSGIVDGVWEGFQYYIGGKIGTGAFNKIVGNIGNAIVQKLALVGIRISLDSLTGAVEVPFQSLVLMMDTRIDNIEGNEVTFEQAWEATGGWEAVGVQTAIAGIGSVFGEVVDFGKAGVKAHKSGTSLDAELTNIYDADLNTAKLNKENPFGRFSKNNATKQVDETIENVVEEVEETVENVIEEVEETIQNVIEEVEDTFDNIIKNDLDNNIVSDSDIAMANYRAQKGNFTSFSFDDASKLPDLDSNFWKNIEHPEQTFIYVDGKNMTFDEALIYKQSYGSYIKDININEIDNLSIDSLDYSKTGTVEAAAAKFASSAKRYVYNDTNKFVGLNKRIADNGLYHFTNSADAIMDSGYIKATGETLKSKIMGESYGRPKTFFFEGIPEAGAFATNIDTVPLKTTAIKVDPTADVLNSPNLKVRNLDDGAITWDGRFDLTDQKVSKQYFVLTVDEGKLKYINVPESVYNSYDNTAAGKQLAEFISNKKNIQAIKDDYLVNTSLKGTGAQISNNSKIVSLYDQSKTILMDKAGFVNLDFFKNPKKAIIEFKGNRYKNKLIKGWRSLGTTDADVEKNLKEIFFDDDYVIGIHRTPDGYFNDSIYNDGLILTGHGMQGVNSSGNVDLDLNITFLKNETDFDYEKFLWQLRGASTYKSYYKKGNAMIVKIPKADINNFDKIIKSTNNGNMLKPEYIVGDIFVDNLNIKSGRFKTISSNIDVKLNDLNELTNANLKLNDSLEKFNNAKRFANDYDVAIKYDDPKQYLYFKLKELVLTTDDPQLKSVFMEMKNTRNIDKNIDDLIVSVCPYLDDNEMSILSRMNDVYGKHFTDEQMEEVYAYSRITGPALTAYERGVDTEFVTTKKEVAHMPGSNKDEIQKIFDKMRAYLGDTSKKSIDDSVKNIDNIIKNAPSLDEDIILYRGVNSVFFDGKQLSLGDIKVGQIINDKATVSTSLLKDKAYGQNDIMLEILAPKGTKGAYIESFVNYSQQEFLLGRNTNFKVISEPEINPTSGKTTIKVEILPPDTILTKIKNTGANISDKFKNKFIDVKTKNNFTTELEENVGAHFDNITSELPDSYPNKQVNFTDELRNNYPNKFANISTNNIVDKMNLRNLKVDDSINKYDKLFNKFDSGVDVNELVDKLERRSLLSIFDDSVKDIDKLYARGQGPGVIHHDVDHVERVMLFAMHMGDELNLNGKDMGVLIQAAKHHDIGVYNGHNGHASLSAMEAINNLQDNYPQPEINKIAAVIEYHEVIKREESLGKFSQICSKYNVPKSEHQSLFKVANILKDADAIDRTRFRNNLDTRYFRNVDEANKLVKTSYQMQEIRGKIALEQKINDKVFTPEQLEKIKFLREHGIPDYVIEQSYETYDKWGDNVNGRYFKTPDAMIRNWMQGARYD